MVTSNKYRRLWNWIFYFSEIFLKILACEDSSMRAAWIEFQDDVVHLNKSGFENSPNPNHQNDFMTPNDFHLHKLLEFKSIRWIIAIMILNWNKAKVERIFPMVISSESRIGQYRDDDHRKDATQFIKSTPYLTLVTFPQGNNYFVNH